MNAREQFDQLLLTGILETGKTTRMWVEHEDACPANEGTLYDCACRAVLMSRDGRINYTDILERTLTRVN